MKILERKIRKVGNSTVITLSKELLNSIGVSESDTVLIDENILKEAIIKKPEKSRRQTELELMIARSVQKHDEIYKELVNR